MSRGRGGDSVPASLREDSPSPGRVPMTLELGRRSGARPRRTRALQSLFSRSITYRLLTLVLFASLWQAFAQSTDSLLIVGPVETVSAAVELTGDPRLWNALLLSNQAMVIGFTISLLLGIPFGFAVGRFRTFESLTSGYITLLLAFPMAAVIPLLIMAVGIGLTSRVILVVLVSVVYTVVNVRAGVRQVDPTLIEMARFFGATERSVWTRILLPASLPAVMAGVRITLGRAIEGMILAELLIVAVGVGNLILTFRETFQPALMMATILFIIAEAVTLMAVMRWIERKATWWHRPAARGDQAALPVEVGND